jgi:superfamily II DNA or RNA helicase
VRDVTVAMVQTLTKRDMPTHGLFILDETHRVAAKTFSRVVNRSEAHYRYGLSATPERADGLGDVVGWHFGPMVRISRSEVLDAGGIVNARYSPVYFSTNDLDCMLADDYSEFMRGVSSLKERHAEVALHAHALHKSGRRVLVLAHYVYHVEALAEAIGDEANVYHGQLKDSDRSVALERAKDGAGITIATYASVGEGVDVKSWDALVLASPISGRGGGLNQVIGRVIRPRAGKSEALIVDIVDDHPIAIGLWRSRKRGYKEIGVREA